MVAPWATRQPDTRSIFEARQRHPDNVRDDVTHNTGSSSFINRSIGTHHSAWGMSNDNANNIPYFERILLMVRETERHLAYSLETAQADGQGSSSGPHRAN
jgi:hypothetical protein